MTEHEQNCLNRALDNARVAEARLRIVEMTNRYLDHTLPLRLSKTKATDQMKLLLDLERELRKVLT